ncbi:26S proteasome non-ATPase regulatory subunit 6 [Smittium mucronatum]|uniref:26S proteasome non-ATPase regulatory subunit 6 n=1 Tax=Smittium mucronatum TaxID=133383 RepID=A0A1R0GNI1_9FUNG|nr:26S proteasome non-ATPase regulatory subunit 6 [Smittium mucronatum]
MAAQSDTQREAIGVPDLQIAQYISILTNGPAEAISQSRECLDKAIMEGSLTFIYKFSCQKSGTPINEDIVAKLNQKNEADIAELDKKIELASEQGDLEVNSAKIERASYYAKIGDKDTAILQYNETYESNSATLNHKLDITFGLLHLGLFYLDTKLVTRQIQTAKELIDRGGDWERRNRLKAYEFVWWTYQRDFQKAAQLFLECTSTFASVELMPFDDFIEMGCVVASLALERSMIKQKLIGNSEILRVTTSPVNPIARHIGLLSTSLYDCKYSAFFESLAYVETNYLRSNRYLFKHSSFYTREMRVKAYAQLLQSYRSLTIKSMANSFGVSEEFIDKELSRFIIAGRLHCVIDKVGGIVETNRPDKKNAQYQATIKQGDLLLNRIQKLSRVINI